MQKDFWLDKWQKAEIGFHMPEVHPLLVRHGATLGLTDGTPVLVPLCGKSVDLRYLAEQGCRVTGLELSPLAIRQFFEEQGLTPDCSTLGGLPVCETGGLRLIEGDFFAVTPEQLGAVEVVYDRAALIAMPPAMQAGYVEQLMVLAPQASILLITLDYPPAEMNGPPFPLSSARIQALLGDHYHLGLLEQQDVLADNIGLQRRGLTHLLEAAWRLDPR